MTDSGTMTEAELRRSGACHEGAHAIVGYSVGWWLNGEGMEIEGDDGGRDYTGSPLRSGQHDRQSHRDPVGGLARRSKSLGSL